jgi:hypothetical protein
MAVTSCAVARARFSVSMSLQHVLHLTSPLGTLPLARP